MFGVTRNPDEPIGVVEALAVESESFESRSGIDASSKDCPIETSPPGNLILVENGRAPVGSLLPLASPSDGD
jgi:hypothetical protein